MSNQSCPYCILAMKHGGLYCSRHGGNMNDLASGVFFIHERSFEECDWHITRLSLNFNFDASQTYFAGKREYRVSPEKYLLINQGQTFKTSANGDSPQRMVTIAFKVGLAEEIDYSLSKKPDYLLDNPVQAGVAPLQFFERTYLLDDFFRRTALALIDPSASDSYDDNCLNEQLEQVLVHLLVVQKNARHHALSINRTRPATRMEIYKRLHWALEYMHDHYRDDIRIEQLALQSCFSVFHFKRLFKEFFGESPYQYIKRLRMLKACELLQQGLPVHETCRSVGWQDASSFVRLFKKTMKITPDQYKRTLRP